MTAGNGESRILTLDGLARNAKDDQGRVLRHTATVLDAHQIAVDEARKVHEFYLKQIPPFVAQMITDALMNYGLIQVTEMPASSTSTHPEGTAAEMPAPATSLAAEEISVAPMEDTAP